MLRQCSDYIDAPISAGCCRHSESRAPGAHSPCSRCRDPALAGKVVVAANSAQGALDKTGVQALFLGRTAQVGGQSAVVVFQKGPSRAPFEAGVVGRSGAQLASHWSRLVFTGRAKAPVELQDDAAVKSKVASTPGAIGYISDDALDATVKVIFDF